MKFTVTLAAAFLWVLPAFAANCDPEASSGSYATYQQVAAAVCNGPCGSESNPCYIQSGKEYIYGWYVGNEKVHCWDAFNNIISQCVQGEGRGGGWWDWDYEGVDAHFYLQTRT